jgi:hypothetical protein
MSAYTGKGRHGVYLIATGKCMFAKLKTKGKIMSIWSYLENESNKDVELLNRAMSLLYVIQADPKTEAYMKERITQLEYELNLHRKYDDRFKSCSAAYDLNELDQEDDR